MRFLIGKNLLGIGAAALLIGTAVALFLLIGPSRAQEKRPEAPDSDEEVITVKTVKPKHDPAFTTSIEQPAYVEGYYTADLMARVAGAIKPNGITVNIHDRVKADEPLVQIDVPDLEQDVQQKGEIIKQREAEAKLATANRKASEKAAKAARLWIDVKNAEVDRALASERFRQKELKRFEGLSKGADRAVTDDIVDERREYYEAAVAASAAARAAAADANAESEKADAKLEAAIADEKVAESLIGVARKDRDKAQALLNFATIRAPFDGIVTRRSADPGDFVQNATTGRPEPLLTVVRDDIVTIYMKVPDKFARYVRPDTEAIIQLDTLHGVRINAKVARYSGSLETPEHDRTMRVEVDLFNHGKAEYDALAARENESGKSDLKSKKLPVFPTVEGKIEGRDVQADGLGLLPGQYGKMRLVLKNFGESYLLPHNAVVMQGGTPYVFVVEKGLAVKVPVEVQADNGEEVKVALIEKERGQESKHDLTGDEEIVITNQGELGNGELGNGQPVTTTLVKW